MSIIGSNNHGWNTLYGFCNLTFTIFFFGLGIASGYNFFSSLNGNKWLAGGMCLGCLLCAILQICCFYRIFVACILMTIPHGVIVFLLFWAAIDSIQEGRIVNAILLVVWALVQAIFCVVALKRSANGNQT